MTSSLLYKSTEFCKLFCALDDLVEIRHRFQEVAAQRPGQGVNREEFVRLFSIAPDLAQHVFKRFDYYRRNTINYNNFLLAMAVFTKASNAVKIDLLRDIFGDHHNREIHRPEILHIVDLIIDCACNLMGVNVHHATYMAMADVRAKEVTDLLIEHKNRRFGDAISFHDLLHRVELHNTFGEIRDFVLHTAVRHCNLLGTGPPPPLPNTSLPNLRFDEIPDTDSRSLPHPVQTCTANFICLHRNLFPEFCVNGPTAQEHGFVDKTARKDYRISPRSSTPVSFVSSFSSADYGSSISSSSSSSSPEYVTGSSTTVVEPSNVAMQGYVYKQTWFLRRLRRRWIVIRNNMLYSFHHESSTKPNIVLSLCGAVCDPIRNEDEILMNQSLRGNHRRPRYALQLVSTLTNISRIIYLPSVEERDQWVESIRVAAQEFTLSDHYHMSNVVHPCLPNVFECVGAHSGQRYMIKYIDKYLIDEADLHSLRIESGVLRFVDHPEIARTVALYEDANKIYILRQFIPHWIRLDEIIRARGVLPINSVALIMRQVITGLRFLHKSGLVLGAFGPANIVLRIDALKQHFVQMVDVGLRKFFVPTLDSETRSYVAPEVENGARIGPKADMWSVGAIIYRLLTPHSSQTEIYAAKRGQFELTGRRGPPSLDVSQTVRRLLSRNPSRRYCAADTLRMRWIEAAVVAPFRMRLPRRAFLPEYQPRFLRCEPSLMRLESPLHGPSTTQQWPDEEREEAGARQSSQQAVE